MVSTAPPPRPFQFSVLKLNPGVAGTWVCAGCSRPCTHAHGGSEGPGPRSPGGAPVTCLLWALAPGVFWHCPGPEFWWAGTSAFHPHLVVLSCVTVSVKSGMEDVCHCLCAGTRQLFRGGVGVLGVRSRCPRGAEA